MKIRRLKKCWMLMLLVACLPISAENYDLEALKAELESTPSAALPSVDKAIEQAKKSLNFKDTADLLEMKVYALSALGLQDQIISTAVNGLALADQIDSFHHWVLFKLAIAEAYSQTSRWKEAKIIFANLVQRTQSEGIQEQIATVKASFGLSCYYNHELNKALELLKPAYEIMLAEKMPNVATTLSTIALVYDNSGQPEKAIEYYLKSIDYYDVDQNESDVTSIYYNLGRSYLHQENYHKAEEYFKKSMEINKRLGIVQGEAFVSGQLGRLEMKKGQFSRATEYLQTSLDLASKLKNDRLITRSSIDLISSYVELGQFTQAFELEKWIDENINISNNSEVSKSLLTVKTELYLATENYQQAKVYFDKLNTVIEQWIEDKSGKQLSEYQVKFSTEIKEKENEILKQKFELQTLTLAEQKNKSIIYGMLFLILLLIILFMVVYLWRERRVTNKLNQMAMTDELTGVANRRQIMKLASEELERYRRYKSPITFCMLDLDHFKQINDTHGHNIGDKVLKKFAEAVTKAIRNQDRFGRIGGEEWLLILPHTLTNNLNLIFNRVRDSNELKGFAFDIRFSMGCTEPKENDKSIEDIINRADKALYEIKENGRDGFRLK